jgi:hypothetical protein
MMLDRDVLNYVNEFLAGGHGCPAYLPKGWRVIGYFSARRMDLTVEQIDKLKPDDEGTMWDVNRKWLFCHVVQDDMKKQIAFEFPAEYDLNPEKFALGLITRGGTFETSRVEEVKGWSAAQLYGFKVAGAIASTLQSQQLEAS